MKIVISGGSGLVGSHIIERLLSNGHKIINLTTKRSLAGRNDGSVSHVYWNPVVGELDISSIEGADGVINLAGFNVSNRWTEANKIKMTESRIKSTHLLVQRCLELNKPLSFFISASASGIYASSDRIQNETAPTGNNFLSELCERWEQETLPLDTPGIRKVIIRIGVVLDAGQGAVGKMAPFFKLGLGAAIGRGNQWMSWIHIEDLARLFVFAAENAPMSGTFNGASPNPVTNKVFSKKLASALHKPYFLPNIPSFALRLLFGEMSIMLTNSQRLDASKILNKGFIFRYPELESALKTLFKKAQ